MQVPVNRETKPAILGVDRRRDVKKAHYLHRPVMVGSWATGLGSGFVKSIPQCSKETSVQVPRPQAK